ncbi:MAG: isochorismate synthase [Marinifilaceae bacterium]
MNFYDIVKKCILADVSMALYRLPDDNKIILVIDKQKAKSICFDKLYELSEAFIFHPYKESEENPIWAIEPTFVICSDDKSYSKSFIEYINSLEIITREDKATDKDISHNEYLNKVNDIINLLNESSLDKLVYSRTKTIEGQGIDKTIDIFKGLELKYDDAFISFVNISEEISWIGASPELLLSMDEDGMHTMALAGTQKCIDEDIIDKVWDNKDLKEQRYVSDYISSKLEEQTCTFEKGKLRTVKAGNICHLQTSYTIEAENDSYWDIVGALHPTPAICGMPAKEAADYIDKMENHNRSYYSGFLGPLNIFCETQMYVNLRSARLCSNSLQLYVGGGITADSIAHKEWDETEMKSTTILNIL